MTGQPTPVEIVEQVGAVPIPWLLVLILAGLLAAVLAMIFRGTLATPQHVRDLKGLINDKTSENKEQTVVIKEQRETIRILTENTQTLVQLASVVEHVMEAIRNNKGVDSA